MTVVHRPRVCWHCGATGGPLFVTHGLIGTYFECPRCLGVDAPDDDGPELITDTFAPAPTSAVYAENASEARLLAIVDKLTGARG